MPLKRLTSFTLAALLLATAAEAHGPTRQKTTQSVEINAPLDKVWAAIGNFQDMSWNPAVTKTTGTGGNGDNATRSVFLKSGGQLDEQLTHYDADEHSYGTFLPHVDVKTMPVVDYSSTLSAEAEDGGKTKVEWRGAYYRGYPNNNPPPELNEAAATKVVDAYFRTGLDALKAKLEAK